MFMHIVYRIYQSISCSYSTNSSSYFQGVQLMHRIQQFCRTISHTSLVPRTHSQESVSGNEQVSGSETNWLLLLKIIYTNN